MSAAGTGLLRAPGKRRRAAPAGHTPEGPPPPPGLGDSRWPLLSRPGLGPDSGASIHRAELPQRGWGREGRWQGHPPQSTQLRDTQVRVCTSTPAGHGPGRPSSPAPWDRLCSLLGALPVSWKGGPLRVRGIPATKLPRVCCNTTAKRMANTLRWKNMKTKRRALQRLRGAPRAEVFLASVSAVPTRGGNRTEES